MAQAKYDSQYSGKQVDNAVSTVVNTLGSEASQIDHTSDYRTLLVENTETLTPGEFLSTDANGFVISAPVVTTDTKNTAGSTNLPSTKLFLVGAQSQDDFVQTYTYSNSYINSNGVLVNVYGFSSQPSASSSFALFTVGSNYLDYKGGSGPAYLAMNSSTHGSWEISDNGGNIFLQKTGHGASGTNSYLQFPNVGDSAHPATLATVDQIPLAANFLQINALTSQTVAGAAPLFKTRLNVGATSTQGTAMLELNGTTIKGDGATNSYGVTLAFPQDTGSNNYTVTLPKKTGTLVTNDDIIPSYEVVLNDKIQDFLSAHSEAVGITIKLIVRSLPISPSGDTYIGQITQGVGARCNFNFYDLSLIGNYVSKIGLPVSTTTKWGDLFTSSNVYTVQVTDNLSSTLAVSSAAASTKYPSVSAINNYCSLKAMDSITTVADNYNFLGGSVDVPYSLFLDSNDNFKDGLYFFTYSYCQSFVYLSGDMLGNVYNLPIRAPIPVFTGGTNAVPGNIRIAKVNVSGTDYLRIIVSNGTQTVSNNYALVITKSNLI